MSEKILRYPGDWRGQFTHDIIGAITGSVSFAYSNANVDLSSYNFLTDASIQRVFPAESLSLVSTQRLFGLAQNSPQANELLALDLTRGRHTIDAARFTAIFLTNMAGVTPELFAEITRNYLMDPDKAILHIVEYMRLHDATSLAFTAAMHGKIKFAGQDYDEDIALPAALREEAAYKIVTDLIYGRSTQEYYQAKGIDKNIVLQTAEEAIRGETLLGQILKAPGIDWIVYTTRDFNELMHVFNIDKRLPFPDIAKVVITSLQGVSSTLAANSHPLLPKVDLTNVESIEQIVPLNIFGIQKVGGEPVLVYDAKSLYELYVKHIILRLYFSGSPWVRGTYRLTYDAYKSQIDEKNTRLIERLLNHNERELLNIDLSNVFPQGNRSPSYGWSYNSTKGSYGEERFSFKNIGAILVDNGSGITTFQKAYPELWELNEKVKNQEKLFLHKKIWH